MNPKLVFLFAVIITTIVLVELSICLDKWQRYRAQKRMDSLQNQQELE